MTAILSREIAFPVFEWIWRISAPLILGLTVSCNGGQGEELEVHPEAIRESTVETIESLSEAYSERNLSLLVVSYPWIAQIHPEHGPAKIYSERAIGWTSASNELANESEELPLLNLTELLVDEFSSLASEVLYEDSLHWGNAGNEILAGMILRELGSISSIALLDDSFARRLAPTLENMGVNVNLFWQNGAADRVAGDYLLTLSDDDKPDAVVWLLAAHYYGRRGYCSWNDVRPFPVFKMRPGFEVEVPVTKASFTLTAVSPLPDRGASPYADCLLTARGVHARSGEAITLVYLGMEERRLNPQAAFFREGVSFDTLIEPFQQVIEVDSDLRSMFRIDQVSELKDELFWMHSYSNAKSSKRSSKLWAYS